MFVIIWRNFLLVGFVVVFVGMVVLMMCKSFVSCVKVKLVVFGGYIVVIGVGFVGFGVVVWLMEVGYCVDIVEVKDCVGGCVFIVLLGGFLVDFGVNWLKVMNNELMLIVEKFGFISNCLNFSMGMVILDK